MRDNSATHRMRRCLTGDQDMPGQPLCTTVVGSYPQPDWLIDRRRLGSGVPRVPAHELWRIPDEFLEQAQDDAKLLAVRALEQARVDNISYAEAVNEEIHALFAAGAEVVQLDEPWMQARPEQARRYAVKAINRALAGVQGTTAVHLCFGYAVSVKQKPSAYSFLPALEDAAVQQVSIEAAQPQLDLSILQALPSKSITLSVLNLNDMSQETPEVVAQRIRAALPYVPPERLLVAPDCGMKYLPRDVAYWKLRAMVLGAAIVREEQRP